MKNTLSIAIVQAKPIYFNLKESLVKAAELVKNAAEQGAELVVFGETWLTGYPAWLDYCPGAALWGYEPTKALFAQMYQNSLEVPSKESEIIASWAKKYETTICMGVNEIKRKGRGNGTIYNSILIFDKAGHLVNHHRKLMPTYTEKLLYGQGDGHGLKTVETDFGRMGGLICWEHWMPLARQAMHDAGELVHLALWPSVHEIHQLASRHYAFEGRCFVIAVGQIMQAKDIPEAMPLPDTYLSDPNKLLLNGGSCVISPDGRFLLEPQFDRDELIFFNIDNLELAIQERITLDVSGHYQRPDVFGFSVKNKRG